MFDPIIQVNVKSCLTSKDIKDIIIDELWNDWWNSSNNQKIALTSILFHPDVKADLGIRRNDHLLSWELFCRNVGEVVHSSNIQQLALHVLRQCFGHLLATVLTAKALKEVKDVRIWKHASRVIGLLPTSPPKIEFYSANKCVKYCASYLEMEGTKKVDLFDRWMKEDLIGTFDEGEQIVQHLSMPSCWKAFEMESQSRCEMKSVRSW
ncbi:hypothetical protein PVL29_006374 [Vitis rotundifolia]|uniref:Uncharacterized protein n=1 Tax=Vitis rotundifolia TaxID=103349 RepID=A0AA39DYT3_VITRO|nr:hypothetical protein PVL29_006374 [Vitis rotundifolia]